MDNIQIETGEKSVTINGDPARVVRFNPSDILFAERFYNLVAQVGEKMKEYEARAKAIDAMQGTDANGLPLNTAQGIAYVKEVCEYLHAQIDHLFGSGTSTIVFEGALSLDAISQFLNGITPYISAARAQKVAKYVQPAPRPRHCKAK